MTVVGARKSMSAVHSDSRSSPRTRGENSSHWLAHLADPKMARSYTVSKPGSAPCSAVAVGMAFVGLVVMRKPSPLHGDTAVRVVVSPRGGSGATTTGLGMGSAVLADAGFDEFRDDLLALVERDQHDGVRVLGLQLLHLGRVVGRVRVVEDIGDDFAAGPLVERADVLRQCLSVGVLSGEDRDVAVPVLSDGLGHHLPLQDVG